MRRRRENEYDENKHLFLPLALCAALVLGGCSGESTNDGGAHGVFFSDVTRAAGIDHVQYQAREEPNCLVIGYGCIVEPMTGGAAVGDVDADGYSDLFVTRLDAPDILYRNRGDGSFEDVTELAGLADFNLQSNAAVFGDLDNDGDLDLFVTVIGSQGDLVNNRNYLFINDGAGVFTEQAIARGVAAASTRTRLNWSVSLGDYDRDGYLDIHITEWAFQTLGHSLLLRNLGAASPGFFVDATVSAGVSLIGNFGFASTFVDLDADGWQDLAVVGDFGTSELFWNNGDGTFVNGTIAAGVGTDENGMGSTFGDFDGDGDLDWFVTSIHDPDATCEDNPFCHWGSSGNRLYRNEGTRTFIDATDIAGVREGFWGWGAVFFDYDNDADLDLTMTNGINLSSSFDVAFHADPMRFWENDGSGGMTEVSAVVGITDTGSGKGLLTFDYDQDGDLDLFVVNNADQPRLYRNDGGNTNNWLRVFAIGTHSNRDAIGARVSVWTTLTESPQIREIGVSSHFLGQSENIAHFGLGLAIESLARIEVTFPASGIVRTLDDIAANQVLIVYETEAN